MTTDVDIKPRRTRLRAAARIAIVVGIAALAFILYRAWVGDSADMTPDRLRSSLAAQVAAALEQATPDEHARHGHGEVADGTKVLCAVDVLGFEPADATSPQQVRRVYANHQCAVVLQRPPVGVRGEDLRAAGRHDGPAAGGHRGAAGRGFR
jgi:hypothetical protein